MDLDQGGRQLAGLILDAAGRGEHDQVADLVAPLDAEQLRSLVTVLAAQVDQSVPASSATGPGAVCELAINAAAPMFGTTPEAILSAERSRPVSDARAVAMTAARETGLSLPVIAEHFNKDHGSVIHAVRRTAERPRLADAAARVSEHVNSRYTARLPRTEATVVPLRQEPPSSAFEPDGPVEHAVVAAAEAFGTTPEGLLGADRSRAAADGRAVAMAAARIQGHSLPAIARHFDRDHTAVLHATRLIEKSPALNALAERIAAELPEESTHTAGEEIPNISAVSPSSAFEPDGPVEHAVVAAAEAFKTTPEVLLGPDRTRTAADARAVAMTAARIHGHSLPTIARHFDRDHTTVLHATRRIEKTPPLHDLAAKIAAELPEQPPNTTAARFDVAEQVPESGTRSPGLREQQRAIPVAGERGQLRVAR
jgi:hypothetical protein